MAEVVYAEHHGLLYVLERGMMTEINLLHVRSLLMVVCLCCVSEPQVGPSYLCEWVVAEMDDARMLFVTELFENFASLELGMQAVSAVPAAASSKFQCTNLV